MQIVHRDGYWTSLKLVELRCNEGLTLHIMALEIILLSEMVSRLRIDAVALRQCTRHKGQYRCTGYHSLGRDGRLAPIDAIALRQHKRYEGKYRSRERLPTVDRHSSTAIQPGTYTRFCCTAPQSLKMNFKTQTSAVTLQRCKGRHDPVVCTITWDLAGHSTS